jgi:hypothetical protein
MFREPSVDACDFLHRYPVDIETVAAVSGRASRVSDPLLSDCLPRESEPPP